MKKEVEVIPFEPKEWKKIECAICNKKASRTDLFTIREKWIQGGGFGFIQNEAKVHVQCDDRERMTNRKIQLTKHETEQANSVVCDCHFALGFKPRSGICNTCKKPHH